MLSILSILPLLAAACGGPRRAEPEVRDDPHIAAVEHGLLPPVAIAGRALPQWSIRDRMKQYRVPGVSLAVIDDGRIAWSRAYGVKDVQTAEPVTTGTLFQSASTGKSITAVSALRLVERGLLDLDQDVNAKLRSWRVPDTELTRQHPATIRLILSHGAGFNRHGVGQYRPGTDIPDLLQSLNGSHPRATEPTAIVYAPGTRWSYSGGGYAVLQQLLIDATDMPFGALVAREVLDPIGMTHSFEAAEPPAARAVECATGHDETGAPLPGRWRVLPELGAGGLWTTAEDHARFVIEMWRAYAGRSKLLSAQTAAEMFTLHNAVWGLGFHLQGEGHARNFSHSGHNDGYRSFYVGFLDRGQGVVILSNGDSTSEGQLLWEIVRAVARAYGWPDYQMKERALTEIDPATYEAYVGTYEADRMRFDVSRDGDRLIVHAPPLGPEPVELYAEGPDRFFVLVDDVVFTFVRSSRGAVTDLSVQPPGQAFSLRKRP